MTTTRLRKMKQEGEKIAMLTSYDFTLTRLLDQAGIEMILVGDSASNIVCGNRYTLPITVEEMIFLTVGELLDLYVSQKFNARGTVMRKHIESWMAMDEAVLEGSSYRPDSAVWFECPEELKVSVMVRSEQCGGRFVTEITRTEWPILRRMHGLEQEVLA